MIYLSKVYIMETEMRVAKWGNSLALRLPKSLVDALDLKEGDDIDVYADETPQLIVRKRPSSAALIEALRHYRGALPVDFTFNRDEANKR